MGRPGDLRVRNQEGERRAEPAGDTGPLFVEVEDIGGAGSGNDLHWGRNGRDDTDCNTWDMGCSL